MKKLFFPLLLAFLPIALSAQTAVTISNQPSKDSFTLVNKTTKATIVVADEDAEVVKTVAQCVADDIELVSGQRLNISNQLKGVELPVIAGTLGSSPLIDKLVKNKQIDVSDVRDKWEVYSLQLIQKPRALVIVGSTPRGTAYGLFELSRLTGVSPYVWWADVTPAKCSALYASGQQTISKEPSVKYRGIFINDEDFGLQPWAAKGIDKTYNNIGPNTYARVMELLLRLRANTLWPAMHLCSEAFWANKDNLPVAKKFDIMLGSSHCEQMLRDNEWEWRHEPWSGNNEDWNYTTNKQKIQSYWEERVKESVGYDGMYTLGMRGVHDWGISGYPSTQDKVDGLTEIIAFQRSLLDKYMGDARKVPQLFIPYKEVLDAYNAGLQVPDDVTLCWVDDNHGYIRQLPKPAEQARPGGNGIYHHLSYWGTPADYLWLCSHSPSILSYELSKAYNQGVRTLWIINVGDIKPAEMELEFCMDLAWDIDRWAPQAANEYNRFWAAKTFGEAYADDIAAIKCEYYRLAAGGKPEHVHMISYSNQDRDQRIAAYKAIAEKVDAVKTRLPERLLDAYFELVEYPVKCAYYMNVKTFRAAQSIELGNHGHRKKALAYADEARKAYRQIGMLTTLYNTGIANGKWNGIMSFHPRNLSHFNMPKTATENGLSDIVTPLKTEDIIIVPADNSTMRSSSIKPIEGIGLSTSGLAVWPIDMKAYTLQDIDQAPFVEYAVPVKAGTNKIEVRCLPTFPINTDYDLRLALAIDGGTPELFSIKTVAMQGKWHTTVAQGYIDATIECRSEEEKSIQLRISMLDPGIVVSEIRSTNIPDEDLQLTEQLIENYDFEYNHDGEVNPKGQTSRGIPMGWSTSGALKKGANGLDSYGVNQDVANCHGDNVCWINAQPMPDTFTLYQTIPASKLEPGRYKVSCLLWVEKNKKTNCRLFANQNVQYYGYHDDYTNLLTAGEVNTYAGYEGGSSSNMVLKDMEVYVDVKAGEDLTIGIKTGNKRNDGERASDNAGWFKVDYFRIHPANDVNIANHHQYTDSVFQLKGQQSPNLKVKRLQGEKKVQVKDARKLIDSQYKRTK